MRQLIALAARFSPHPVVTIAFRESARRIFREVSSRQERLSSSRVLMVAARRWNMDIRLRKTTTHPLGGKESFPASGPRGIDHVMVDDAEPVIQVWQRFFGAEPVRDHGQQGSGQPVYY